MGKQFRSLTRGAALLLMAATPSHAEVVADWLAVAPKALSASPRAQSGRASVLANLAMFNALNAITPATSYGPAVDPVPDASPDAAAATAAFTVLSSVPGADQAALAKTLEESLKPVTDAAARAKAPLANALPCLARIARR